MLSNKFKLLPTAALLGSVLFSAHSMAHSEGDLLVRAGLGAVLPNESSDGVLTTSEELELNNDVNLAGTVSYMLSDNMGIEVLLGLPFTHEITTAANNAGAVADVSHLPLSVAVQYYFGEANSTIRPYVGAGFNYTTFLDEEAKGDIAGDTVSVDNSFGYAFQAGVDFALQDNWFANASIWYLDVETTVHVSGVANDDIDTVVDPLALMLAIGYTF